MIFIDPNASSSTAIPSLLLPAVATALLTSPVIRGKLGRIWQIIMQVLQVLSMLISSIPAGLAAVDWFTNKMKAEETKKKARHEEDRAEAREDVNRLLVRLADCSGKYLEPLQMLRGQYAVMQQAYQAHVQQYTAQQQAAASSPPTNTSDEKADQSTETATPTPDEVSTIQPEESAATAQPESDESQTEDTNESNPTAPQPPQPPDFPSACLPFDQFEALCLANQHVLAAEMALAVDNFDGCKKSCHEGMKILKPLVPTGKDQ